MISVMMKLLALHYNIPQNQISYVMCWTAETNPKDHPLLSVVSEYNPVIIWQNQFQMIIFCLLDYLIIE